MTTFLMRHTLEHERKRPRWCVDHLIDPRSLSAAYLEEMEVIPPREEGQGEMPPEPRKMACLLEM